MTGAKKGVPATPIPPSGAFPLPYVEEFEDFPPDSLAPYFADQYGSFAVRDGALEQVALVNPGALAWSGDGDPLTLVGDVHWTDVNITVSVMISDKHAVGVDASPVAAMDAAMLRHCDLQAPEQRWMWDVPSTGYLRNNPSSANSSVDDPIQCLNAYGCAREAAFYACVTSGGSCCGNTCYDGLKWTLTSSGQLQSALSAVGCLTAMKAIAAPLGRHSRFGKQYQKAELPPPFPPVTALTLESCGTSPVPANQTFLFNTSTGQLKLNNTELCLSQTPSQKPYAQVCTRIGAFAAFKLPNPPTGYCLVVASDGSWRLTNANGVLVQGVLPAPPLPTQKIVLRIATVGNSITVLVDGTVLGSVSDRLHPEGMIGLGSSFNSARFDNFLVTRAN